MATMFVRPRVADFSAWKKVYDGFAPTQKARGVTAQTVYQSADDPHDITVTNEFGIVAAAKVFVGSKEMSDAMQAAGVTGEPTIWFTTKV